MHVHPFLFSSIFFLLSCSDIWNLAHDWTIWTFFHVIWNFANSFHRTLYVSVHMIQLHHTWIKRTLKNEHSAVACIWFWKRIFLITEDLNKTWILSNSARVQLDWPYVQPLRLPKSAKYKQTGRPWSFLYILFSLNNKKLVIFLKRNFKFFLFSES